VVERAVLHHQHDERVDRQVARGRQLLAALVARRLGHEHVRVEHGAERGGQPRGQRGALQELAPAQRLVGVLHAAEATGGDRRRVTVV
jgi:hypothetical protein